MREKKDGNRKRKARERKKILGDKRQEKRKKKEVEKRLKKEKSKCTLAGYIYFIHFMETFSRLVLYSSPLVTRKKKGKSKYLREKNTKKQNTKRGG